MLYIVSLVVAVVSSVLYIMYVKPSCVLPSGILQNFATQHTLLSTATPYPLLNRVAIVTGATSGLGQEIASELYRFGATVVLASRSESKLAATKAVIESTHRNSSGILIPALLDTSDLRSVQEFAAYIVNNFEDIHYLVNNAGIHYVSTGDALHNISANVTSSQGYDLAFATNYLGHFLLTKLLLPTLQSSGEKSGILSKIIQVSSGVHALSTGETLSTDMKTIPIAASSEHSSKDLSHRFDAYANNKLAQILHTRELQKRLDSSNITSVMAMAVCPGWVSTGIIPQNPVGNFVHRFAFSSNAGSLCVLCALFRDDIKGGAIVTNYKTRLLEQSWFTALIAFLTKYQLRSLLFGPLAIWVLAIQSFTYGCHETVSSPESYNETLWKVLYEWSEIAVDPFVVVAVPQ